MKIFIDPGHGGSDNGAAWGDRLDYLEEDDLNLTLAFFLRYELLRRGHEVDLSRYRDIFVPLADRAAMANSWKADLFISIHADAWHNETTSGISTHIHPRASVRSLTVATAIQDTLAVTWPTHKNRGVRRSDFQVLRETLMPAVLIETEFITNSATRRFLKEPANQMAYAVTIARAVHGV